MTVKVDDKVWREIVSAVSSAKGVRLQVGVIGAAADARHPDSDLTVSEIALIHEYGSTAAGVPERSFIGKTFDKRSALIKQLVTKAAKAIIRQRKPSTASEELNKIGMRMVQEIHTTILTDISPALNPITIAKKGHDQPLIDSGILAGAISYKIVHGADIDSYYESMEIYEELG